MVANSPASGTSTEQDFRWILEPGSYTVALRQNAATLALLIDNSGSLGPAIYDALDAAEGSIRNKPPDEEISLFSFNHAAVQLVERTDLPPQGSLIHNESLQVLISYSSVSVWASASGAEPSNCSSARRASAGVSFPRDECGLTLL